MHQKKIQETGIPPQPTTDLTPSALELLRF